MINLNTSNTLPTEKLMLRVLTKIIILFFILSFPSLSKPIWFFSFLGIYFVFFGLPVLILCYLIYKSVNFIVDDNKITINSGVIAKKSKFIPFKNIQNITNYKGILRRLFNLSTVNIWTSSASQIILLEKGGSANRPDGSLTLNNSDSEWLQKFILERQPK